MMIYDVIKTVTWYDMKTQSFGAHSLTDRSNEKSIENHFLHNRTLFFNNAPLGNLN